MSIWAEIKYAINGRLGTGIMKPLNELITDAKTLTADENNLYLSLSNKSSGTIPSGSTADLYVLDFDRNAEFNFKFTASRGNSYLKLEFVKSGTVISSTLVTRAADYSMRVSVTPGEYIIRLNNTASYGESSVSFSSVGIYAKEYDSNIINYREAN